MSGSTLTRKAKSSSVLPGLSHYITMTKNRVVVVKFIYVCTHVQLIHG